MATARNLITAPSWHMVRASITGWYRVGTTQRPAAGRDSAAPFGRRIMAPQPGSGTLVNPDPAMVVEVTGRKWEPGKRYYFVLSVNMPFGTAGEYTFWLRPGDSYQGPEGDLGGHTGNGEKVVASNPEGSNRYYHIYGYVSIPTDTDEGFWRDSSGNPVTLTGDEDLYFGISTTFGGREVNIGYIRVDDAENAGEVPWFFDGAGNTSTASENVHPEFDPIQVEDPALEPVYVWDTGREYESPSTVTYISSEPEPDPVETNLSLDITPSEVMVGEPITLTANVTPVEATGSVSFTMDGITSSVPVEDGQAVTEVTAFEEGDYEVVAEFIPSGSAFLPSSATGSVTVTERPPVELTEGEYAEVNLWDEGGIDPSEDPASWEDHTGIPPGLEVSETDRRIILGTPTEAGSYTVEVMGEDSHFWPVVIGEVTILVAEGEPDPAVETTTTLSVTPSEITEGESISLTATVTPADATGSVDFSVNGITSSAQVIDGVAVSEVSIFEWGTYEVLAEFVPTDEADFLPSSDTSSVNVLEYIPPPEPVQTTTTLTVVPSSIYEGGSAVLKATVSPAQAQGSVTFTLDGATVTVPVAGGIAAREVTVMNAGEYEVNVTFAPVSEDYLPSTASPRTLSVQTYVEPDPVDPGAGPWDTWEDLATNLAPKVAAYAGRPDHAETIETAQAQLPVVAEYVRGHTRGRGFESEVPASALRAVIVSACARLVTNPEQVQYYAVGDYSERPALLAGWTLTELDVLRRYRRTYA